STNTRWKWLNVTIVRRRRDQTRPQIIWEPARNNTMMLNKMITGSDVRSIILSFSTAPRNFSKPRQAGVFSLQRGFQLGIGVRFEGGPIECRFNSFAVGRAEPKFYGQLSFAHMRMFLELETFVQL